MFAAGVEFEPGPGDEILDRARDEHLARRGERSDSSADRDSHSDDLPVADLALAGVDAGTDLEVDCAQRVDDPGKCPNDRLDLPRVT